MAASDDRNLDAMFHALADSTRRVILDELAKRDDQPLFEICVRLVEGHGMNLTRQAISKHLTVLENADLVDVRWRAARNCIPANCRHTCLSLLSGWTSTSGKEKSNANRRDQRIRRRSGEGFELLHRSSRVPEKDGRTGRRRSLADGCFTGGTGRGRTTTGTERPPRRQTVQAGTCRGRHPVHEFRR